MKKAIESGKVWSPRGRGFSMALLDKPGNVMFFTGQVAWDSDENIVGINDVAEQTRQCFRNIEALLKEAGGSLENVVSITTYFIHDGYLEKIQSVRSEFLNHSTLPVSTSVRVAGLGHKDFLVELTPIAVLP